MVQSVEKDSNRINSEGDYNDGKEPAFVTISPLRIWQTASIAQDGHILDTKLRLRRSIHAKRITEFLYFTDMNTLQERCVGVKISLDVTKRN